MAVTMVAQKVGKKDYPTVEPLVVWMGQLLVDYWAEQSAGKTAESSVGLMV